LFAQTNHIFNSATKEGAKLEKKCFGRYNLRSDSTCQNDHMPSLTIVIQSPLDSHWWQSGVE